MRQCTSSREIRRQLSREEVWDSSLDLRSALSYPKYINRIAKTLISVLFGATTTAARGPRSSTQGHPPFGEKTVREPPDRVDWLPCAREAERFATAARTRAPRPSNDTGREGTMRTRWRLRAALATIAVLAGLGAVPHARADQASAAPADSPEGAVAASIRLVPVTSGLDAPLFLTSARDGSRRLFVLERSGRVRLVEGGKLAARPFLDLTGRVLAGGEQGLLGLAFHPGYRTNGRFFVDYTRRPDGATVVAEYRASSDPDLALPSGRTVLVVPQPFANHNGGALAFGPDGLLYIGRGDGGSEGDPGDRAQDRNVLLGKVLRIDVDGAKPYAIPPGNPFVGRGGRDEIYALGFRNPWRFSFDRGTGLLYAGDVGQGRVEEVDIVKRGDNYGWRIVEGNLCFSPATGCNRTGLTPPIATYRHTGGRCAIMGGYVYRGRVVPGLAGTDGYGDFCSGEVFGLRGGRSAVLLRTGLSITSFGEDEAGELYVTDLAGGIRRVASK